MTTEKIAQTLKLNPNWLNGTRQKPRLKLVGGKDVDKKRERD